MKYKQGKSVSIASYQVLTIFSKHYNKWYVHWGSDHVLFEPDSKKYKVLMRMVVKEDSKYSEVELDQGGDWETRGVYCMKHMSDIVNMEEILADSLFSW